MSNGLPPGFSRETTIRRDDEGRWFHDGILVTNPKVAQAFDRWIDVDPGGRFILKNDINWAFVTVEGAPMTVISARVGPQGITLWLSDDRCESLNPDTVRQGPDGRVYCSVRDGRLTARFSRRAVLDLAPALEEDGSLRVGDRVISVPIVENPLIS